MGRRLGAVGVAVICASVLSTALAHASGAWALQSTPNPVIKRGQLAGVSCPSSTVCTAVGSDRKTTGVLVPLAERWNGSSWAVQALPAPVGAQASELDAVSCASSAACSAVGDYTNTSGVKVTLAERWNGSSWTIQSTPNPSGAKAAVLSAVACPSTSLCTAVGNYTNSSGVQVTLAERWNGSGWMVQATPSGGTPAVLSAVACPSTTLCTAVGKDTNSASVQVTLAERWNGSSWVVQSRFSTARAKRIASRS